MAYQRNQLVVFYGVDRYEWRYNQQTVSCFFKSLVQNLDMLFCGGQTKGGVVGAQRNFLLVNKVVGNLVGWIIEKPFSHISYRGVFFRMENIHVAKNNEMMLSARYRYIEHIVFSITLHKKRMVFGRVDKKRTIGHFGLTN